MTTTATIYWTAYNNSSYLAGHRTANTLRAAVRDARRYLRDELQNEGIIRYYDSLDALEQDHPCRVDERSLQTGYRWLQHQV